MWAAGSRGRGWARKRGAMLVFWATRFGVIFLARAETGFIGDFLEEIEGSGLGGGTEEEDEWIFWGGRIDFLAGIIFPEDFGFFIENYKPK